MWLKEGDRNTSFFHAKASRRFQTNSIRRLKNSDGSWSETMEEVQQCILNYFQNMFISSRPLSEDIQQVIEHLPTVVDAELVERLSQPFTEDEVTKALFNMSPLKSPGPDGLPPVFFHKFWHVVKLDVVTCVLKFLNERILPTGFNDTNIVLIPKCKNPVTLAHFRPISLCNVVYKIASKTIANRLKPWLDSIISPSQSAFVPGRLITDNVLMAFEINHYLNTRSRGQKHFLNLKLDISKAYNRVEWSFLQRVLESLSSLFRHADERGTIPGVTVCRGAPRISHLLFADDTMVFCPANSNTVDKVRRTLEVYRKASGQEINLTKSSAAFSRNTPMNMRLQLANLLGIRLENKHEVYLGLPAVAFRSKRALFAALKDRIWKRISGWHEKTLSKAGKACLIQSVVQAIPSYAMSCFRLPKTLLKEFQSLSADFFWHDGKGIALP
ncbi:UNVERIFIED_CONTAM: hypothetical protein Slati_1644200 [Sesamum latifolium]|uniref:Reverse transcriptase domain-containing protein n=1 Tax=Sesamum latifolium TaxID=2727402 RepID=A0AAW2XAR0_9LAMI